MAQELAPRRLGDILGASSPEVPREVLLRDAQILFGGQGGYRINKYGTLGLDYVWEATGEAVGGPTGEFLKAYKTYISKLVLGLIATGGLALARGFITRIILFGMAFEEITWALDQVEAYVLKAAGVT
ncbi:MAG: hypothetical protein ACE5Z5_08085 [Candidatus Bathyarchaeia archaeon]